MAASQGGWKDCRQLRRQECQMRMLYLAAAASLVASAAISLQPKISSIAASSACKLANIVTVSGSYVFPTTPPKTIDERWYLLVSCWSSLYQTLLYISVIL